jgi:hypothetical protein
MGASSIIGLDRHPKNPWITGDGIKVGPAGPGSTGWKDITANVIVRGAGATDPNWSQIGATAFYGYKFALNDKCWMIFHVPHDILPSSDIHLHAHWLPDGTNANTVKWQWQYAYAKGFGQEAFDLASLADDAGTITAEEAGPGTAYTHMVTETAAITLTDLTEPDGLITTCITRITNGGTDNTDGIFLLTADVHYQSTGIPTIGKAPNFYA